MAVPAVAAQSSLRASLASALAVRGLELGDEEGFYADLCELALRVLGRGLAQDPALAERLGRAAGVRPEAQAALLEGVRSGRFGHVVQREELRAFGARFGPEALARLEAQQQAHQDIEQAAARWDAPTRLRAMEVLFALARTPRGIPSVQARALDGIAERLGVDGLVTARLYAANDPRHGMGALSWRLMSDRITVGSGPGNEVVLPDPTVARHHCTLLRAGGIWRVVDAGSGRPLLLDGQPVQAAPLSEGQSLRVGPWRLSLSGDRLWAHAQRSFEALTVRDLGRSVPGRTLLERVDLTVFPGELVAIIGPSGSGKTTLLHTLAGLLRPDTGEVRLGDADFHALLEQDPSRVGFVPQDDLLLGALTVEESLRFAGRLRYAGRLSEAGQARELERVIEELGLADIRHTRVGDALRRGISGGQRKRVNLGQELMTRGTRLLFLDEPTAGLDPRSAQDIVRQVRQLADHGRMVFLVTHDLSPAVMAQVDHLLILVPGGQVAFFGPVERACRAFEVSTPDQIFARLEERSPADWAARWRASEEHRDRVELRRALAERPPSSALDPSERPVAAPPEPEEPAATRPPSGLAQVRALCARYALTRARDLPGLAVLFVQPLVLAALIYLVFPVPTAGTIFLLSLSGLWFGMSGAVRELIVDRALHRREQKVGVGLRPYLGARLGVLAVLHGAQCGLFTVLVAALMGLGGYGFDLGALVAAQVLTGLVGVCLGLAVSALVDSSEAAVGSLPLLILPNICFGSLLVSLRDMGGVAQALAAVSVQRYAFDLSLKAGTHLGAASRVPGRWDRVPMSGPLYELGLKPASAADSGLSPELLVGVLLAFAAVALGLTALRLRQVHRTR